MNPSGRVRSVLIKGTRVLGAFKDSDISSDVMSISFDATTEAHLIRHFKSLSNDYILDLLRKPFKRYDIRLSQHVSALLDESTISELLETQGSKFFTNVAGFSTPRDVFDTATEHCRSSLSVEVYWLDKGDRDVAYFLLKAHQPIGIQNAVNLDKVPANIRESVFKAKRGKGGNAIALNFVKMHPPETKSMVIMLQRTKEGCRLETAYPDIGVTDLPQPAKHTKEELALCEQAWKNMAFVKD